MVEFDWLYIGDFVCSYCSDDAEEIERLSEK